MNTENSNKPKKPLPVKKILAVLVALLATLALVIQLQPEEFHVERSLVMNAQPAEIFAHVNDLQKWEAWSPFAKMDPDAKVSFAGPQAGLDAAMSWDGEATGAGTMTVVESRPSEQVKFRLDFTEPFAATSTAQFTFTPEAGGTKVTWAMDGHNDFIGKAMSLVMDCDKMMGGEFEKGLASIKSIVES